MFSSFDNLKVVQEDITKPLFDDNEYKALILPNNLKVLLISDKNSDISGAVLSVLVGHQQDPDDLNGLAHFLEHMLFLGSKKFPDPSEFEDYMKLNGGSSNALTDHLMTSYYFDIKSDAFEGALDRFSGFFTCPLFDPKYVDREVNAVNSEHNKNLLSDLFIRYHVMSSLARKGHPLTKFGTGSIQTLKYEPEKKGIDVIKELKEFHNKYYSSNCMFLTLISNHTLIEMQNFAIKYFSDIENKSISKVDYFEEFQIKRPYISINESPEYGALESVVYLVPNKEERRIVFNYQLPDIRCYRKGMPEMYFCNILGHEGPGSLTSLLKRNGWCHELSSGLNEMYSANLFEIAIKLTEKGSQEIYKVIQYTLNYVNLIVKEDINQEIISDLEKLSQIIFDYRNKPTLDDVINHSLFAIANDPPLKELFSFGNRVERIDVEAVKLLKQYFEPTNLFIFISLPENKELIKNEKFKDCLVYDKHYNLSYLKMKFNPEIQEIIRQVDSKCARQLGLKMPQKNKYIPEDLSIINQQNKTLISFPFVLNINDNPFKNRIDAYFKPDTIFCTPHGFSQIFFFSTQNMTIEMLVLDTLASLTLTKLVAEEAYDAILANLDYKITGGFILQNSMNSISISICGFSDKMPTLLSYIIESFIVLKNDVDKMEYISFFNDAFEECRDMVRNSLYNPDIIAQLTSYNLKEFYSHYTPSKEEILAALESVTYSKLCRHISDFFCNCIIKSVIIGNFDSIRARRLVDIVSNKNLLVSDYSRKCENEVLIRECIDLESLIKNDHKLLTNKLIFCKPVLNSSDKNGCVLYNIDFGKYNLKNLVLLELLSKYLNSNCYFELRTNQQLGYIVGASCFNFKPTIGITIRVQSSDYTNNLVINRIDKLFHEYLVTKLEEKMNETQFKELVDSEIKIYSNKPKNLKEEILQYLSAITNGNTQFDWKLKAIDILRTLNYSEFKDFVSELAKRPRIIIHSLSPLDSQKNGEDISSNYLPEGFSSIENFNYFKNIREESFKIII